MLGVSVLKCNMVFKNSPQQGGDACYLCLYKKDREESQDTFYRRFVAY